MFVLVLASLWSPGLINSDSSFTKSPLMSLSPAPAPDSDDPTPTLAALMLHRSLSKEETLGENRNN